MSKFEPINESKMVERLSFIRECMLITPNVTLVSVFKTHIGIHYSSYFNVLKKGSPLYCNLSTLSALKLGTCFNVPTLYFYGDEYSKDKEEEYKNNILKKIVHIGNLYSNKSIQPIRPIGRRYTKKSSNGTKKSPPISFASHSTVNEYLRYLVEIADPDNLDVLENSLETTLKYVHKLISTRKIQGN